MLSFSYLFIDLVYFIMKSKQHNINPTIKAKQDR